MKPTHRLLILALAGLFASSALAQQKVAIIDLRKVFDGYYKTKEADVKLKERGQDILKLRQGMLDDFKKAQEEYNKVMEGAKDPSISSDERDKRKRSAEAKLEEIREIEANIRKYDVQAQDQFVQQNKRMREKIIQEIKEVVDAKAKIEGYALVLDTASESRNETPVVVFNSGQYDITQDVLKKLNENAPPPSAAAKPEEKKEGETKTK
ncbi:MAG: OmpH family outer membrane protein [Verrucomicrobia bacterium]|nr:OmpH family outer membrane protein [Verrucomicrobiota bacterium]